MKKLFTISAVVLFSTVMFAGGPIDGSKSLSGIAVMQYSESGMFKVYYKAAEATNVKISILNEENKEVFAETIRKVEGFVRPYSFQNLSTGDYTIRIEDGNQVQVEKVHYGAAGTVEKLIQVRKLANEEGKYLLTASGRGKEEITVNIFDSEDKLIYSESQEVQDAFAKVYNLNKVKGGFSFEIVHANGIAQKVQY